MLRGYVCVNTVVFGLFEQCGGGGGGGGEFC